MSKSKLIPGTITVADGWYAVYYQEEEPYYEMYRLVGWCWRGDTDGEHSVVGLTGGEFVSDAEDSYNFVRFIHKDEMTPDMMDSVQKESKAYSEHDMNRKKSNELPPTR